MGEKECLGRKGGVLWRKAVFGVKRGVGGVMDVFGGANRFFRPNMCVGGENGCRVYWGVWVANGVL